MTDAKLGDPASPFIEEWAARLRPKSGRARALDVAMGRGRHAILLARHGFKVFGVDIRFDAVSDVVARAAREDVVLRGWCADLTRTPLPPGYFSLIVVTRYLQRDLCAAIADALVPGGTLLYETFTEAQRMRGRGPTSSDHLLKAGELPTLFRGLDVVFYDEVAALVDDAVARLAARKRSNPS